MTKSLIDAPMALALSLALAGCAVGPDFHRPRVPDLPERFARASADAAPTPSAASEAAFWQGFNDPQLSALIDQALAANNDLRLAVSRYDSANARLRETGFDRFPTVTANAQAARERLSDSQRLPGQPRNVSTYSVGANASWELDLFGRVRREIEASQADLDASAGDLRAVQVAIVGDLASAYFDLRGTQERLRVARANAETQRDTLKLTQLRQQAGRDSQFDTARARAQLETTSARIPVLEAQAAADVHRIAVLTGQPPEALIATLSEARPLPSLPGMIDPGTPGDLLRRRPDITAAEARLHAATARVGVTTADLYPRFTLQGLLGTQAARGGTLFKSSSATGLIGLGIDWSFLDTGRVRARIDASQADAAGVLAQYQQIVLLALEDTENALVRYVRTREELDHLASARNDSTQAAALARVRYTAGSTSLLELLQTERDRLQAEDAYADTLTRGATGAVALYKALAGGWPDRLPEGRAPASEAPAHGS